MKHIIKKTDEKDNVTYFSVGNTRWVSDKANAKQFDSDYDATLISLSIPSGYELEVIEYGLDG